MRHELILASPNDDDFDESGMEIRFDDFDDGEDFDEDPPSVVAAITQAVLKMVE